MIPSLVAVFFLLLTQTIDGRFVLSNRTNNIPPEWIITDDAEPEQDICFYIVLKEDNRELVETFHKISNPKSPIYRHFLSNKEIDAISNPPNEHYNAIINWICSYGVNKDDITVIGPALKVKTKIAITSKLFDTEFRVFKHQTTEKTIVRHFGPLSIPEFLVDFVELVLGLSEFPLKSSFRVHRVSQPLNGPAISVQSLESYYQFTSVASSTNNSAAVAQFFQQYFSTEDMENFANSFNIYQFPYGSIQVMGFNDPTNPQLDSTIQTQYLFGIAPNISPYFWIEPSGAWLYGLVMDLYNNFPNPYVVSISYGWNEEDQCDTGIGGNECSMLGVNSEKYVTSVNNYFARLGLRGVTIVCSSGDDGVFGSSDPYCDDSTFNPYFPASSPYVLTVGATQIDAVINGGGIPLPNPPPGCSSFICAGSGGYEEAVSYDQANFVSGGGFSFYVDTPAWQQQSVQNYLQESNVTLPSASFYNPNGRAYPDVSAIGSNLLTSFGANIQPYGSTGVSSAIFAGMITLLNDFCLSRTQKPLGFTNNLFYEMSINCPACFKDITVGNNSCTEAGCSSNCQGFQATNGWDPVTGIGTPNIQQIIQYLGTNVCKQT